MIPDFRSQRLEPLPIASLALPYCDRDPPHGFQLLPHSYVTSDVLGEFRLPEGDPALRSPRSGTPNVTVPKAAVNEHGNPAARKDDVRPTRYPARVETVPQTGRM
jgi:hypothetical protein